MRESDDETLSYYDKNADTYAKRNPHDEDYVHLRRLMAELPPKAHVCDLGSGNGWASVAFRDAGFDVTPVDGSAGLAAQAKARHDLDVEVMKFEEFSFENAFDGLWASWSLHHAKRTSFPDLLERTGASVRPGGLIYLSVKGGAGENRDTFDRFYAYYEMDELLDLVQERIGADILLQQTLSAEGFDGLVTAGHCLMFRKIGVNM